MRGFGKCCRTKSEQQQQSEDSAKCCRQKSDTTTIRGFGKCCRTKSDKTTIRGFGKCCRTKSDTTTIIGFGKCCRQKSDTTTIRGFGKCCRSKSDTTTISGPAICSPGNALHLSFIIAGYRMPVGINMDIEAFGGSTIGEASEDESQKKELKVPDQREFNTITSHDPLERPSVTNLPVKPEESKHLSMFLNVYDLSIWIVKLFQYSSKRMNEILECFGDLKDFYHITVGSTAEGLSDGKSDLDAILLTSNM
ncbi:unnamed protein product [Mytilus edulis]|uniref:Uncharacterized protein n=1 Tax=Mytilus edulis TaxID=6550 RepID=A0A8S3UQ37_MYTED|nr:unnamed protein product [Mytilus edulis]